MLYCVLCFWLLHFYLATSRETKEYFYFITSIIHFGVKVYSHSHVTRRRYWTFLQSRFCKWIFYHSGITPQGCCSVFCAVQCTCIVLSVLSTLYHTFYKSKCILCTFDTRVEKNISFNTEFQCETFHFDPSHFRSKSQ